MSRVLRMIALEGGAFVKPRIRGGFQLRNPLCHLVWEDAPIGDLQIELDRLPDSAGGGFLPGHGFGTCFSAPVAGLSIIRRLALLGWSWARPGVMTSAK